MTVPLVLLHPLGVDNRFWDPVRPFFEPDLITPDLHGSTVEEMADGLDLTEPVDLAGVSLGGLVAQVLAARRPGLVRRLVLVDTVAVYPPAMREMWRQRADFVPREGLSSIIDVTEKLWFTEAASPDAVSRVRALLLSGDVARYARACQALAAADTTELAPAIKAPTLVVCGRHDAPPFHAAVDWFAANLPDVTVTWLPGAHGTAYEHPHAFADAVAGFLE
ncbi:alpha/beta fold hydrolase [Actinoplanes sp. TRM 88003]|uniref:Alpha/beta fold hydrolase n=1 Tax=Paractinoplanes aksuensis TaxID=2939490 RepID=A0ABT1E0R2_9ACTN|nr:alpha/beta fold hydrolase [Actinoplanes aksuensis]MCO8276694.1 alpha/beta fold hydrolase [Actinoplanes aksuensis]